MRDVDPAYAAAAAARTSIERRLVWMTVKHRTSGATATFGFWNGHGRSTASVKDGLSGTIVVRTFRPGLVKVGEIRLVSDLSIETVNVELNGIDASVESAIRGFTPKQAPIQIYSALLDRVSHAFVCPAEPLFTGFIDTTPVETPAAGDVGAIVLVCVGQGHELSKTNPQTRSNASQKQRAAGDKFFKFVQSVPDWKVKWGAKEELVAAKSKRKDGR